MSREKYYFIKPHHFLDMLYDLAINNRHENEVNVFNNNNALITKMFIDGKIKKIKFTPNIDDICRPCKKIINNKCIDIFDEKTTKKYRTNSKHIFNYDLDMKLNNALPSVFDFNVTNTTHDILINLKLSLTKEIIEYYRWKRPNRVKNTFKAIEKALKMY